ncbi:type 1 periplasmic binding fold superfamily protein [Aquimarina algicola]|uniref:Type 1 periplasmic binding fold superfamily protein n=1 Tax=Aquimarina algicola TaxID=2589995 RepID=A0A504JA01_9FLAO|nr:type 1 periplasmic binding fold superfamily protein [Aquimarina algicola]TPN87766.1 type 1 periplasmic binding fold superfamily protein [Aquimarina algicola]
MNTNKFLTMLAISGTLFISSCSDDDDNPDPANEGELITTMTVTLTNSTDTSDTVVMRFFDEDGENGPTEPTPTVTGTLKASTTYNGSVAVLNESEDPVEIVTEEIQEEADEHQFFFITDDLGITTAYTDNESNYENAEGVAFTSTNPVGLTFTLTTTDTTGDVALRVVLRHELDKDASGVAEGNIANAGGSPDIDWTFNTSVE